MAKYLDAQGHAVTADEALINGHNLRAGFRRILDSGETASLGMIMCDSAPGGLIVADASLSAFRDSPQGREFVAYLHSAHGPVPTVDAENEAIRRHLAVVTPVMSDADHAAAIQRMQDAWIANDPNAWRKTA